MLVEPKPKQQSMPLFFKAMIVLPLLALLGYGGWYAYNEFLTGTTITRAEFGTAWPFTVDQGVLRCERVGAAGAEAVTFSTPSTTYSVNGLGDKSLPTIMNIVLPDPADAAKKMSIYPIIDRGIALCK